ncbi:MAG: hypothetical protein KAI77_00395, partial [Gammaproteobacteria bacterium]|nr:hypothetical protein [Gammaproteobacteria bacterium]
MFDLPTVLPQKVLSLTRNLLSTAISLALVIVPFSSSIATELQHTSEIELTKKGSLRILYQDSNKVQFITQKEHGLVEQFALENQLTTEWIAIEEDWQLMQAL